MIELTELNDPSIAEPEIKKIEQEISRLLSQYSNNNSPSLEQLWKMMDSVWDELGCDNQKIEIEKINQFYQHPVWTLNGLFIEKDEASLLNRQLICDWIGKHEAEIKTIIDYGAGMGSLAKLITMNFPNLSINLYEPYPSQIVVARLSSYSNIHFVNQLNDQLYDCLISTDVLEHIPDPLPFLAEMIDHVRPDGYLIIANCFYPVIKCHLPCTFHLRYTFDVFTRIMGLKKIENLSENYIDVYQKTKNVTFNWRLIRFLEKKSQVLYRFIEIIRTLYHQAKY
ncbi:MAG: methyltransferase domain-containing protein [Snowella sp.]|nr:methyltransferase domain-containing protein [Snowella sp.]